jgi:hypothetical protein
MLHTMYVPADVESLDRSGALGRPNTLSTETQGLLTQGQLPSDNLPPER